MRRAFRLLIGLFLICTAGLQLLAQYSQQMSLGRSTLYTVPSANIALREAMPLRSASVGYFLEVGGVTFESVARPRPGTSVSQVSLSYRPSSPDGQRLIVTLDGQQEIAPVFDWQFIPTARFAASPYTACFTLFGDPEELNHPQIAKHVRDNFGRVIKFAPALKNTLVGLRLMQLDMLIISPDAVELPKLNSQYVLGAGETRPNIVSNVTAAKKIGVGIDRFSSPDGRQPFDSYVINDQNSPIYFSAEGGTFTISGAPSYYAFRIVGRETDHPRVVPSTSLNDWLRANTPTLRAINPAVWDNAVMTARYAAFFRFVKRQNPDAWDAFLLQIAGIDPRPKVLTPDVVIDPREREIADFQAQLLKALQDGHAATGHTSH